jgi:hypothetical protein
MAGPGRARHRAQLGNRRPYNFSIWRSFLTYRIASAGVVTTIGAVTRPAEFAQSCPACPCCVAGECPLHARAIVIFFSAVDGERGNAPCRHPPA